MADLSFCHPLSAYIYFELTSHAKFQFLYPLRIEHGGLGVKRDALFKDF